MADRRLALRFLLACFCTAGAVSAPAATLSGLFERMDSYQAGFDRAAAERAAVAAALKAVDARAELLTTNAAAGWGTGAPVAAAESWTEEVRYLKVRGLYRDSGATLTAMLTNWMSRGASGIVLDLRGAGGYDLDAAAQVASLVTTNRAPVLGVCRAGETVPRTFAPGTRARTAPPVPWAVLTDAETTDASEALAAALRAGSEVLLVGAPTRGDWSVRELVPCGEQMLWIATGVVQVGGRTPEHGGVQPDLAVTGPTVTADLVEPGRGNAMERPLSARIQARRQLWRRVGGDAALVRAVDALLAQKALRSDGEMPPILQERAVTEDPVEIEALPPSQGVRDFLPPEDVEP